MEQSFTEILVAGMVKEEVTRMEKVFISSLSERIGILEERVGEIDRSAKKMHRLLLEMTQMMRDGQKVVLQYSDNNINTMTTGGNLSTSGTSWH